MNRPLRPESTLQLFLCVAEGRGSQVRSETTRRIPDGNWAPEKYHPSLVCAKTAR